MYNVMQSLNKSTVNEYIVQVLQWRQVWFYFLKEVGGENAKCKKCQLILKAKCGSTKGLLTHFITKHGINLNLNQSMLM